MNDLLKEIDRIWAHVPTDILNRPETEHWSQSKAREETRKAIEAYIAKNHTLKES